MFGPAFRPVLALSVLLVAGCAGPPRPPAEPAVPARVPILLVVDKLISGQVLGKRLNSPAGMVVDHNGRIILADTENNRLLLFDPEGLPLRYVGGRGAVAGTFDHPTHLFIDSDRNVWVADRDNRRLCRFSEQLLFSDCTELRDETDPLLIGHPAGFIVNDYGEIWMSDIDNDQIVLLGNLGNFDRIIGDHNDRGGELETPAGMTIGPDGRVYVCDAGNRRVVVYDDRGGYEEEYYDDLLTPTAVAFDPAGILWVLDSGTGQLHLLDNEGRRLAVLGPWVEGSGRQLAGPTALVFDRTGRLLISDTGNDRLIICRIVYDQETPAN